MYLAIGAKSLTAAIELSGSSIFTLGTTPAAHLGADAAQLHGGRPRAAAGHPADHLSAQHLRRLLPAGDRRQPAPGPGRRARRGPRRCSSATTSSTTAPYRLTELWQSWEDWFADIEETHTTFPSWRSSGRPRPEQSWITAAGTLLDGASCGWRRSSTPRTPTPSSASGPASWPCGASPSPSASTSATTPTRGPDLDQPPGVGGGRRRDGRAGACPSSMTATRRGRPGGAGGSTTTPSCSTWPAWSRPRRPRGSRTAARSASSRPAAARRPPASPRRCAPPPGRSLLNRPGTSPAAR